MLRLLLLRHAKAAPQDPANDRERPLIERGRTDAALVGRFIAAETPAIEAAVHSGARRAKQTLAIVLAEFPRDIPVLTEPRLYGATTSDFLRALAALPDAHARMLVVGHNPSLGDAANRLAGAGNRAIRERMAVKFPTSALAILDFDAKHWADIGERAGRLVAFITPASLSGG